jgi:hypothetical protein
MRINRSINHHFEWLLYMRAAAEPEAFYARCNAPSAKASSFFSRNTPLVKQMHHASTLPNMETYVPSWAEQSLWRLWRGC